MSTTHSVRAQAALHPTPRLLASLLLALALLLMSAPALFAQDPAPEPQTLLMGQLATATLAAGDSVSYIVDLPESTTYVITTGDDAEAAKFTLVITDRRGAEVFNDVFATTQIDLKSGDHAFTLTANEDATLSLFVTGQLGELSTNYGDGTLENGSFVTAANVKETQYAELAVEKSDIWQQVFINVSGDDGDAYSIYVSGDDAYASVGDNTLEGPAVFWSRGGDYHVEIAPVAGGKKLTAVVLLSGPVPELAMGEATLGTLNPGTLQTPYRFTIPEAGVQYTVTLASDVTDVDLDLAVALNPTTDTWTSYNSDSNEAVTFVAPVAGEYFARIFTTSAFSDTVDYSLTVQAGEAAPVVTPGQTVWDSVAAGGKRIYTLPVDEANQLLVVTLVANAATDLDLTGQIIDGDGNSVASLSSYNTGSFEALAQALNSTGVLQIEVDGGYASEETPFALRISLEPQGAIASQWAITATASSEYSDSGYTAAAATGAPDVPTPSDNPLAWTGKDADGPADTLELTYAHMVAPTGVRIYESFNPGAVTLIEAYDADADAWTTLWEGEEPTEDAIRVFSPTLSVPDFLTNRIRLTVQNDLVAGWNEIDAVQLQGLP